jgi:hypothetical protein
MQWLLLSIGIWWLIANAAILAWLIRKPLEDQNDC